LFTLVSGRLDSGYYLKSATIPRKSTSGVIRIFYIFITSQSVYIKYYGTSQSAYKAFLTRYYRYKNQQKKQCYENDRNNILQLNISAC